MEQEQANASAANQPPLSNLLSSLLSNPEMMAKLGAAMGQMSPPPSEQGADSTDAAPAAATAPSLPSIPADGLATVLSNPELMARLPDMMAMLKPMMGSGSASAPSPAGRSANRSREDCRSDLLLALKPFLSPERCHAVDTMLRISKLGTVIRQIK